MNETDDRRIGARLRLIRYLITESDRKGKTHGEKHHFHEVALSLLRDIEGEFGMPSRDYKIEDWQVQDFVDSLPL